MKKLFLSRRRVIYRLRTGKIRRSIATGAPVLVVALLIAALTFTMFGRPAQAIGGQERLAYYGNWDIYANNYFLKDVDRTGAAKQLTTLVYSFENIDPTTLQCFQTTHAVDVSESNPDGGTGGR